MVEKIANYWRVMVERKVVSTHRTKAEAIAALRAHNKARPR